jgi:hypothetical protein
MRRRILSGVAGSALALALFVGPVAAADKVIGTPGEPNCEGQTTAYLNNLGHGVDINGQAALAAAFGLDSVKDLKAIIRAYCNP